ncbi:MAG: transposase, partial [Candidatus Nealsonbacteria bacterium]|nr:transposase [Candidatus Nealsonbacteria bacterium]
FKWPKGWPAHQPLVKILSYCLKENHFHLLLKEIHKGGLSFFMKRLSNAFTGFINLKYGEVGRVFQGAYKGKTIIKEIESLHYLDAYIQAFNPFEDYPGGIEKALKEFDKAFEFALSNPFCSLGESFGKRNLEIIDRDILKEMFPDIEAYKEFAYDALLVRNAREVLGKLTIED